MLLESVSYYRWRWSRLGGLKLHAILKGELGEEITHGRDSFLKILSSEGLTLPNGKRLRTTDSSHPYRKYPNLTVGLEPQNVNHVWVSDITYVWMVGDVLYLRLVSDMYSHVIIGWILSETTESRHTTDALEMVIQTVSVGNLCGTIQPLGQGCPICQLPICRHTHGAPYTQQYDRTLQSDRQRFGRTTKWYPQD